MLKVGKEYKPYSAKITKGGEHTQFSMPQSHRNPDGRGYIRDGFINVLAKGSYDFHEGDAIVIKQINGATVISWNGKQYFSIYADIEYKSVEEQKAEPNKGILEDDIPDDLF